MIKTINKLYKRLKLNKINNDLQIFIKDDGVFIWEGVESVNKKLLNNKRKYKDTELEEALNDVLDKIAE